MTMTRRWWHGPWRVPALAGALILAAVLVAQVPRASTASDLLMVAAAVVAGTGIARAAVRALAARSSSIDLLVTIAATGAVVIGEYWEAAAVTFLFAVGHALEVRTLGKTRSALAALVAAAPDVAVVVRDRKSTRLNSSHVKISYAVF